MSSSLHVARAKAWGTNTFVAEWFCNAVDYCRTKEGQKAFKAWLVDEYGRETAKQKLLDCQKPPLKRYGRATGNVSLFNAAAVEFGISDEAMQEYHKFTANSNLCAPPRTKPAPKRRRGETSTEWLARRHDALLLGCKVPDIDWRVARAMAIAEFDKARDTYEIWHTDYEVLLDVVQERTPSSLLSPNVELGTLHERLDRVNHAFTSCLHAVTLSYMIWGHALDVFEELDRRGLASTSAIERAYQRDPALMWRLVLCLCHIDYLRGHLWERLTEVMSWSEYYRPYFKRYRSPNAGSRIEVDRTYLRQNGGFKTVLDNVIIEGMDTDASHNPGFFDNVLKYLDQNPTEANKFSNEAFQTLGDVATVWEFKAQLFDSAFGQRLMEFAKTKDELLEDPKNLRIVTFMEPSKLESLPRNSNDWTRARTIIRSLGFTWLQVTNQMGMGEFFFRSGSSLSGPERQTLAMMFDFLWAHIDGKLWQCAMMLDRSTSKGTVAQKFGVFDPADPERPSFMKMAEKRVGAYLAQRQRRALPANPSKPKESFSLPAVEPAVAASGHAYVSDTQHLRAKEKVKTRGTAAPEQPADLDEEEADEILPDALPTDFKIGNNKVLKVFHRILQAPDIPHAEDDSGPRTGQVRWGDFEKAMKRIGFGIAQTAGSSVRFDPPAKLAHPITFHRPHPDSTLTPTMLKWIGARLKRCYGWTTATFGRAPVENED
ncbi:regulation of transcription from pol ii promoter-related protein [Favolaschia claudopus]|uniref:Regulation of transcription from pol ii promoter-related protein n=1 Tax=Favolaschia claudopus TaxID=2862362 RepID=A0AAW0CC00_9AGAR